MNNYTFDIGLTDGEILRHTITAASRFIAECIIEDTFDDVEFINFIAES